MGKNYVAVGVLAGLVWATSAAAQQIPDAQRAALKEIRDTAADICYTVEQKGSKSDAQLSGEVQAKVNGAVAKLADIGIKGTGNVGSMEYQGVSQEALGTALTASVNCRERVFDKLLDRILPASAGVPSLQSSTSQQPPSQATQPTSIVAVAANKKIGLQGSITQITSSDELRYISVITVLKNISNNVLEVTGNSYDIKGTADNGQEYVSTPPSFEGISECGGNNSQVCPVFIQRGNIEMTEIEPGEEVRVVLKIFKSLSSHGNGPISDLLALSVPFFYRQGLSNSQPPGISRRAPQPVALTFGRIPLVR